MGAVGWEPHGSSPTTCAGKADHGIGVCVPLTLICCLKIVNYTVLLHKEFEIPTLRSEFFEILKFVFLSEVAHKSFWVKFSGLISKLKILKKSCLSPRIFNAQTYIWSPFKAKKLWCANETFRISGCGHIYDVYVTKV